MSKSKTNPQHDIRIGTLVPGRHAPAYIAQIAAHGFESYSLTFRPDDADVDFKKLAKETAAALQGTGAVISSLGAFGNPLGDLEKDERMRKVWQKCIDAAPAFGCDVVAGFAGRVRGVPIPDSIKTYKKVFTKLSTRAADKGVRIAFENCSMGGDWNTGDWNIAHSPAAWELMFDALDPGNIGLEWEPCHQMVLLIEPLAQLRKWVSRVFHVHGKDATIRWDVVRELGISSPTPYVFHRTPGFGDTNWSDVITELRLAGFKGAIDIEGWHDPVWHGELEMTGQVHALNYLKQCRGGDFVPNPVI